MSRFRINSMAAALGLEDEDVAIVEGDNTDAALVESSTELDSNLDDAETAMDTSETISNDAETVENLGEVVEDSIESGEGLDETSAAVVQETVENIMKRHGMPRRAWPKFPSLEAYSNRSSRLRATKQILVSLEGVWNDIKSGIMKAWEAIRDFFVGIWKKFTDFEYRLLDKFRDVEAAAKKLKSGKTEAIELGSLDGYLDAAGETVKLGDIQKAFEDAAKQYQGGDFKKLCDKITIMLDDEAKNQSFNEASNPDRRRDAYNKMMSSDGKAYSQDAQDIVDQELAEAKFTSAFSNVNRDKEVEEGKAKKIEPASSQEVLKAIAPAISLLRSRPMTQMEKVSDGFFVHIFKSIKAWFSDDSESSRNSAEGGITYDADDKDQKVSRKEQFQKMASAYKYIMYNNIKVYKDTIGNYYDIIDDLVGEIGHDDPDDRKDKMGDF